MGRIARIMIVSIASAAVHTAFAQWPDDPATNLAVADRTGGQTIPLVATAPDGSTYIGWFDPASGNFDVYLQRLNADGVEQWPHNGILVSDHPQNSALFGWDLMADSAGNCVLVFSDERDGSDLDIQAYKIGPDGDMLWGPNGITISDNPEFEPAPKVTETDDGDFVFVWQRSTSPAVIMMQRVSADGVPELAAGGIALSGVVGESPAFVRVVPTEGGDVMATWVRDSGFTGQKHVRAQRFDETGAAVWPDFVPVFDSGSVPIAYTPGLISDGENGAVVYWHRSQSNFFNSFVQRLDSNGTEAFAHNGVAGSTDLSMHHIDPAVAFDAETGNTFVFWNERNSSQSAWGIYGQMIDESGARQWGEFGLAFQPVDTIFKSSPRALIDGNEAMVFYADEPTGMFNRRRVLGIRVDASGAESWPETPIVVSSVLSSKSRLPVTIDQDGVSILAWEDDRSGNPDIYAQNVNRNGTLGSATGIPGDTDGDGDVDLVDFAAFQLCFTGPGGSAADQCNSVDFDDDGDVDLADFGAFQLAFTGAL